MDISKIEFTGNAKTRKLGTKLRELLDFNSSIFLQYPMWGESNFSDLIPDFERRFRPIAELLSTSDLMLLSDDELEELTSELEGLQRNLNRLEEFTASENSPAAEQMEIRNNVRAYIFGFEKLTSKFSSTFLLRKLNSLEKSDEAQNLMAQLRSTLEEVIELRDKTKTASEEINNVLDSVRSAAPEIGIEKQATIFEKQSNRFFLASIFWLVATAAVTAISIFTAAYFYEHSRFVLGDYTIMFQILIPKIVIFGILTSIVIWTSKNYRSVAHESAVNKHRANALSTFRTFVEATTEQDVRNAVLLEATRSIFSQAPSGFLDKNENQNSDMRMVDVIRTVSAISPKQG